jgi:hypothetical protein
MRSTVRRSLALRPLLAALVALALTTGAVFANGGAAPPDQADFGLERAKEASGKTVPVRSSREAEEPETEVEPAVEELEEKTPEEESPEEKTPDEESSSHGATVSDAARNGPPEEEAHLYRNHGAWVSSVARANRGQENSSVRPSAERGAKP